MLAAHPAPIWALEEVVDTGRLATVAQSLGGYAFVAAQDASVTYHWDFGGSEQTALLYDTSVVTVDSATDRPRQRRLRLRRAAAAGGRPERADRRRSVPLTVVVIHMKAYADHSSYNRRVAAAGELKAYLDTTTPTDCVCRRRRLQRRPRHLRLPVVALALCPVRERPRRLRLPHDGLTEQGIGTYGTSTNPIDHQMVTNELAPAIVAGSVTVLHPPIAGYLDTTSDHYPVQVTYHIP